MKTVRTILLSGLLVAFLAPGALAHDTPWASPAGYKKFESHRTVTEKYRSHGDGHYVSKHTYQRTGNGYEHSTYYEHRHGPSHGKPYYGHPHHGNFNHGKRYYGHPGHPSRHHGDVYGKGYSHHEPGYSHEEWEYRYNSGTAYRTPAPPAYYGAGVASPDYGYRRDPVSEGLIGGALGAATGAAIGAVVGDPGDGAAIGAAIGGINGISRGLLGRGLLW